MRSLFLVLMLLIISATIAAPFLLPAKKIECISQYGQCSAEVLSNLENVEKERWFLTKKELSDMLSSDSRIRGYQLNYQFPQRLVVHIFERKPEVAILRKNDDQYILVDRQGYLLGRVSETPLPVLQIVETGHTQQELESAAELFFSLFSTWGTKEAKLYSDSLRIFNQNGTEVIFPLDKKADLLVGSYNLVLSWLNSENKDFTIGIREGVFEIDFRYKNPVLRI